jgi:ribosome maturation factor RimP
MRSYEHPVVARIRPQVEQTLADFGYELVVLRLTGRPGRQTLTVIIDKPGGVTIADCEAMAARISLMLDIEDPIQGSYNLIVSSPGVDRPLTRDEDLMRFEGKLARVRFTNEAGRRQTLIGRLGEVQEGRLALGTDTGTVAVPLEAIETANLVYAWEGEETGR